MGATVGDTSGCMVLGADVSVLYLVLHQWCS